MVFATLHQQVYAEGKEKNHQANASRAWTLYLGSKGTFNMFVIEYRCLKTTKSFVTLKWRVPH